MTDDSPTPEQIAAAAPELSPETRERLRRALMPAVPTRGDYRRSAVAAARKAVSCLQDHDETAVHAHRPTWTR